MNANLRFIKLNNQFRNFYSFNKKTFGVAQNIIDYTSKTNPRVYLVVSKNGVELGKLTFEVNMLNNVSYTQTTPQKLQKTSDSYALE